VYATEMSSCGMMYITIFHYDRFRHSSNIKVITSTILEAAVLVLLIEGFFFYVRH
jgi:hypothetical protein